MCFDLLWHVHLLTFPPMQAQGTFLERRRIPPNKPTHITSGARIGFGGDRREFIVDCETCGKSFIIASILILFFGPQETTSI